VVDSAHENAKLGAWRCRIGQRQETALRQVWLRWRSWGEDGQSLVEFGIVVPLLLLVLTGIFSFGVIFNQYQVLTNATNSAARAFALSAGGAANSTSTAPSADPCAYVATIVSGDVPGVNTTNLNYKIVYTVNSTSASTTYTGTGSTAPTCANLLMNSSDTVQVTVTYPVTALLYSWTSKSYTLTATSTEFVQ
jgi:Flp pilus assembly protein TadG